MLFGVHISEAVGFNPSGEDYISVARHAEALGFNSLWVGDHVVIPKVLHATYPYTKDGSIGFPPRTPWPDPITLLSALGPCTKTIRLCTGISVVPYRNPLHMAKAIGTADLMSNGRVVYGVGLGWLKEEFETLGIDFKERAARTDEYLRIMKAMWTGGDTTYKGRFFAVPDLHVNPLPVQKPHPPIMIGGQHKPAFKRVVALGDGWMCGVITPDAFRPQLKELSEMLAEAGRKLSDIKISMVIRPDFARNNKKDLEAFEAAGLQEGVLYMTGLANADAARRELDSLAKATMG